jgi:hypothetical protein
MVNISRKSNNGSSLTAYTDTLSGEELVQNLAELVEERNLSTDDRILEVAGTIHHIEQITSHINNVAQAVPQALQEVWQEERVARQTESAVTSQQAAIFGTQLEQDRQKFLDKLSKEHIQLQGLLKIAIGRVGNSRSLKLQHLCWSLGGCISGLAITSLIGSFIVFPRQLSLARGNDGAMLEWLSTPEGRLMRRSFAAGNTSVAECVRKGARKSKKFVCMLEIN